ncbi:acetyl-CoA synthetase-like protein [Backusella circina FSU 941]|nr:acetyl-CoA synthetase-like protein [Backusella circina FSU 941]
MPVADKVTTGFGPLHVTSIFDLLFNKNPNHIPDDAPIYISSNRTVTFGELPTLIRTCAYNLQEKFNIQKGDVVAIRSIQNIDYPLVLHGVMYAGGVFACVKHAPEDTVDTIADDLETVNPKVFITDFEGRDIALQAAAKVGIAPSHIIVIGDTSIEGLAKVEDVLFEKGHLATPMEYSLDDFENFPLYLFYTSGSTGKRKVIPTSLKALLHLIEGHYPNQRRHDRILANRPFYFSSCAYFDFFMPIVHGDRVYISRAETTDEICQAIEAYGITTFASPPYIVARMAKEEISKRYRLPSLKLVMSMGSVITKQTVQLATEQFGAPVVNLYGTSEFYVPFDFSPSISAMGASGTIKSGYTARLVDEHDRDVAPGERGEFLIKGPTVMKGYYNNPEKTAEAFTQDGFYRTGDVFIRDKDGLFWFVSRCKNLMKYYSTHIYSYELEKVILNHPKVADCAVLGIYSQELSTELPRAYVSLVYQKDYANRESIAEEILAYANAQLNPMKQIRAGVVVRESLYRTPSGKILYDALKQEVEREQRVQ